MLFKMCILLVYLGCFDTSIANNHIYVSPEGSDTSDGKSPDTAVKTVHRAMNLSLHESGAMVYIELMAGYHDLDKTLNVPRNKVTIRSYKKQEVHVTGGTRVPSNLFQPVTDESVLSRFPEKARSHVRVAHLPDVGITDYGVMSTYGFGKKRTAPLEVFFNGIPLHLARWPNEGFINIVGVLDGENGTRFRYNATQHPEPLTWRSESEPWTYGYWGMSWADESIKLQSLDASTGTVKLTKSPHFGLRLGHWNNHSANFREQGGYFRFINILSALDETGEYYMDRDEGNLYVWFPSQDGNASDSDIIYVSLIDNCISLEKLQFITFEGFTMEACRAYGIYGVNVHYVEITQMEFRNTGCFGVYIEQDSRNCSVSRCLIHDTDGGIYLQGGDRPKLEPSGNVVENNEIFRYARVAAIPSRGIFVVGVGHVVRYNHVYIGQNSGVWYYGNDILMEYNLLHHHCMNSTDCGAFHTGRDWTTRGNVIRHNIVHDNVRLVPGGDVRGVMLDGQHSSTTIRNNVFYNNNVHANIGGGRDNIIENNVMYNATGFSVHLDHRGTTHKLDESLTRRLHAVPYNSSLWISHYPELAYLNLKNADLPEGNQILKNYAFNINGTDFINSFKGEYNKSKYFNTSDTGYSAGKADFYDADAGDFRLKGHADEWAKKVGFGRVVSLKEVGPRVPVGPPHTRKSAVRKSGSGCWIHIQHCPGKSETKSMFLDRMKDSSYKTDSKELACLSRAKYFWKQCGSDRKFPVTAYFRPTMRSKTYGINGDEVMEGDDDVKTNQSFEKMKLIMSYLGSSIKHWLDSVKKIRVDIFQQ